MDRACGAMHLVAIEEKVAFCLLTYGFNIKRKYKRKYGSIRSINSLKLIKRVQNTGRVKCENKVPPFQFC